MDPLTTPPPAVPAGPPQRSGLGLFAVVAGVLGVVLCVVLIAGLWIGRGWATDQVHELARSLDAGLERGAVAAQSASAQLSQAADDIGDIAVGADQIAANPAAAPDSLLAIGAQLTGISDGYRALRVKYGEVKEFVTGALSTLQQLSRFTPGLDVPQGPVDTLATIDDQMLALDASLSGLLSLTDGTSEVTAAATAISQQATTLQGALGGAAGLVGELPADVDTLRAEVADIEDDLVGYIGLGVVGLTIFLVWVLLLNVALIVLGRRWRASA